MQVLIFRMNVDEDELVLDVHDHFLGNYPGINEAVILPPVYLLIATIIRNLVFLQSFLCN